MPDSKFDGLSLSWLRKRRSDKWARYGPDVLPAWVAEMDFPLAPAVQKVLVDAIELGDCGYAHEGQIRQAFAEFAKWNPVRPRDAGGRDHPRLPDCKDRSVRGARRFGCRARRAAGMCL